MGHSVTIGGERLGSGKKMKAYLHNYERSTHDLSFVWRSTMAAGTLVPFLSIPALPGDTFDIDLNVDVLTHPTIGPLFGTYKIQLDVFQVPIRLYQGKLHMNMLGIGMEMQKVPFPQISMDASGIKTGLPIDNQQINPSSILSYLGIRGLGVHSTVPTSPVVRTFNAIPYLGYWDIYKNYYANKQEEIGVVIHKSTEPYDPLITAVTLLNIQDLTTPGTSYAVPAVAGATQSAWEKIKVTENTVCIIAGTNILTAWEPTDMGLITSEAADTAKEIRLFSELFNLFEINTVAGNIVCSNPNIQKWNTFPSSNFMKVGEWEYYPNQAAGREEPPKLTTFPLTNIDDMRKLILADTDDTPFIINYLRAAPYGLPFTFSAQLDATTSYAAQYSQEGLGIKTYQSDLFNNWISTEWIDGPDGISELTAIDTSGGSFTIDELNMSKKVYEMLNRIAISGGTYDDWLDAVYTHQRNRSVENPMYLGGLIRNLVFQEVVSNAATTDAPLGTLAGRGKVGQKDKGGHITAKVDEPSYIMGIISLTPNIDYSQGNSWDMNLQTMNDLHKPALDEIGFQDLVTDQMAWFDTLINPDLTIQYRSAGKQPAWINYMTAVNKVYGNFAEQNEQMFMVLNRRYSPIFGGTAVSTIKDLTTYIDPSKFNHIFADTRLDAQNFWTQIHVGIQARRKMSAKIMPNL